MKLRLLLFGLLLSSVAPVWAQDEPVDVTTLLADTKTFIFSNNRSTVKGYIYAEMEAKTSCCGSDRIYLEVKIDPSGYVLSAKTLTGRNDCFMQSAVDIVKNIKWNTEEFKGGPRSVYFEIKPDISCDGGKANTYAAVEIFNNELLNGNQQPTTPVVAAPKPQPTTPAQPAVTPAPVVAAPQQPAPQQPAPTTSAPVATAPAPATTAPAQPEPVAPAPQPVVKADDPVVIETPTRITPTQSSPPGLPPRRQDPVAAASPTDPPRGQAPIQRELTEEEKQAIAGQEAERQRREEEIRQLKEEMARMRAAEEQVRETKIATARNNPQPPKDAFGSQSSRSQAPASDNGEIGFGLFMDELPLENGAKPTGNASAPTTPQVDPNASQEERIRSDVARMEQRIRELEQTNREVENDIRRRLQDAEKANREIVQLAEEKARREEEGEQLREQRELDRIAENKRRIEDDRSKQEREVQKLQDDLARMQSEMQTKMKDLDRQQQEIDRVAMERQQREQEIMLTRALREKETEVELERMRLERLNSNILATTGGGVNAGDIMPDFATAADSEKYVFMINQINMLREEVNTLRGQLGQAPLPQTVPGTSTQPASGAGSKVKPATGTKGTGNAATNRDWENIDIVAPGLSESDYIINPKPVMPTVPAPTQQTTSQSATPSGTSTTPAKPAQDPSVVNYRPGQGYSPDPSHVSTHTNVSGPELTTRTYVNGETALKELVKEDLRKGGVCGLAHVLFSVTLKPDGTVLNYRILTANATQVSAQMGLLIPNLKFNAIDARYNQTIYQEIKAEIVCEGGTDVNLQSVQPFIED
ncbi:MAG: hypothetical protein NWR72_08370 [Bacteroidia bacterium]|nr:hypothetical protein [Bacteroidia bacterium]